MSKAARRGPVTSCYCIILCYKNVLHLSIMTVHKTNRFPEKVVAKILKDVQKGKYRSFNAGVVAICKKHYKIK